MRQRKQKALKQVLRAFKNESKVPIIVESKNKSIKLEKELIFVIDPQQTFLYFSKTLSKKLEYTGALNAEAQIFYSVKGKFLSNPMKTMGQIFDKYRSQSGWLQIQIQGDSTF